MPSIEKEFNAEQLKAIADLRAQIFSSTLFERPSKAYALKGLLCELLKPQFMAPSYIVEKLSLLFDGYDFTYKAIGDDDE